MALDEYRAGSIAYFVRGSWRGSVDLAQPADERRLARVALDRDQRAVGFRWNRRAVERHPRRQVLGRNLHRTFIALAVDPDRHDAGAGRALRRRKELEVGGLLRGLGIDD